MSTTGGGGGGVLLPATTDGALRDCVCRRADRPTTPLLPQTRPTDAEPRSPAVWLHSKLMTLIRWKPELHSSPPE